MASKNGGCIGCFATFQIGKIRHRIGRFITCPKMGDVLAVLLTFAKNAGCLSYFAHFFPDTVFYRISGASKKMPDVSAILVIFGKKMPDVSAILATFAKIRTR